MLKKTTDILILGAGIGGYEAFRSLSKQLKKKGIKKCITLIDQNNYFTFTPMLHEVASGSVQASHCAIPIRQCIHKTPHEFWQTKITHIDPIKKIVQTSDGEISYEYCVVALGSKTNYFGTPGAKLHTEHVRNLPAAIHLHQKFIHLLEDKSISTINMVIVGGGATGVELAGQFSHLVKTDIATLYPEKSIKITIVQSNESLLPFTPEKVRKITCEKLEKDGVHILLKTRVKEVTPNSVILTDGKTIPSNLTAWTAGFATTGDCYLEEKYCQKGQIVVTEFLQSKASEQLYAIGDISLVHNPETGTDLPKLGEIAHLQGEHVAKNICLQIKNKPLLPFTHKSKGTLIPIGDWFAVAHLGPFIFHGRFAWWLRRTVYLAFIPGFLRKLRIVIDWTLHSLGFRHIVDINLDIHKND